MARASRIVRDGAVQKAFWLRNALAERLDRVVRERRRADGQFSERRALALAIRAFVEQEEKELGGVQPAPVGDLLSEIDDLVAQVRAQVGKSRA